MLISVPFIGTASCLNVASHQGNLPRENMNHQFACSQGLPVRAINKGKENLCRPLDWMFFLTFNDIDTQYYAERNWIMRNLNGTTLKKSNILQFSSSCHLPVTRPRLHDLEKSEINIGSCHR